MHTTGFAEAIDRLYEGDCLATALADARARTLAIYAHLDVASLEFPRIPIVNPAIWELSHIAWFQEYWCLRHGAREGAAVKPSRLADADALFDSSRVPHAARWSLPYPPAGELFAYMRATLEATLEALRVSPCEDRYFFALSLLHEDMHGEALLMTLQTLALPAPPIEAAAPGAWPATPARDVAFDGGEFAMGAGRDEDRFVFDNEKWAHPVRVAPFRMADRPVTQGEFLAFVRDGGYAREDLWTPAGWRWLAGQGIKWPRYWREEDGAWFVRRFDQWLPLDPNAPVLHVSLHAAQAYCRWANRRLPTEAEWEFAACNGGDALYPWGDAPGPSGDALDYRCAGPAPSDGPAPGRAGLRHLIGGVWEWTATPFGPYPGFRADPYAQYSEPWFASHYVLRGGSFATRGRLVHNRFRNFYLPERADVFAGFRTCAVE